MNNYIKKTRNNIQDMRKYDCIDKKILANILNDFENALDLLEPSTTALPPEHFKITPAFKLSLDYGGEYHEEHFDTEAAALAAASRAASELPQVPVLFL